MPTTCLVTVCACANLTIVFRATRSPEESRLAVDITRSPSATSVTNPDFEPIFNSESFLKWRVTNPLLDATTMALGERTSTAVPKIA